MKPTNGTTGTPPQAQPMNDKFGRPLRDLRISVTDRCNFRCPYCMPAEIYGERYEFLPKPEILTFEEIERLSRIFVGLGANKLRITGGEPLVRAQLPSLIEKLSNIDGVEDLTLTTNGFLLAKMAQELRDAGLKRITVSLDSVDDEVAKKMSGRPYGPARTLEGIEEADRVGLHPIKINTVVQRGVNDHTIVETARRFKGTGHIVRFIEFMDVGNRNGWNLNQVVTAKEIVERINAEFPIEPVDPNYRGEVANRYAYRDGSGEIGVIASVSMPFCGDCTRARLSTEGTLVTCLFASGGKDLKTPMRNGASDEDLRNIITGVWSNRTDRYSDERASHTDFEGNVNKPKQKIEMYQIGG
ncbi:MAG: GTP 3',8-cyclase MoaA [Dehalococcoidia bacterium]